MPSAHWLSNGNSGSPFQMPDFDGVHDFDDVCSLLEHNSTDCGQPILMPFQLTAKWMHTHAHIDNCNTNHNPTTSDWTVYIFWQFYFPYCHDQSFTVYPLEFVYFFSHLYFIFRNFDNFICHTDFHLLVKRSISE